MLGRPTCPMCGNAVLILAGPAFCRHVAYPEGRWCEASGRVPRDVWIEVTCERLSIALDERAAFHLGELFHAGADCS